MEQSRGSAPLLGGKIGLQSFGSDSVFRETLLDAGTLLDSARLVLGSNFWWLGSVRISLHEQRVARGRAG